VALWQSCVGEKYGFAAKSSSLKNMIDIFDWLEVFWIKLAGIKDNSMFLTSIPILAYHQIIPVASLEGAGPLAISVDQFERQMRYLYDSGYRCMSLIEFLSLSASSGSQGNKTFALTFDDGYEDFFSQAFPILQHYGFTATVFLVTNLVGTKSNWEGGQGKPLLTWDQIRTLHNADISFGSHTHNHPVLPRLSRKQIYQELATSKACIETKLGQEAALLAYPYGKSNTLVQSIATTVGYRAACGVVNGKVGPFNLWRCECHKSDTLQTFIYKLTPRYRYLGQLRSWLRDETRVGQLLRQIKRRRFAKMGKVSRETFLPDLISNKGVD
jgi:peptidoglycan/xylan/chitin deacetylase (PgdA/CDA1 family)